jgi:hypothetical protein
MAKRYGHIGQVAQRQAVEILDAKRKTQKSGAPKKKGEKRLKAKDDNQLGAS